MDLQPANPALLESLRSGAGLNLSPPASAMEARPVTAYRTLPIPRPTPKPVDEVLVPDQRAALTPAQSVERKLTALLRGGAIAGSHFRMAKLFRSR